MHPFWDASSYSLKVVKDLITEYEVAWDQLVNYEKSFIYFGANEGVSAREMVRLHLEVRTSACPEKYLDLSMMIGRGKKHAFAGYLDRLRNKVDNWNTRFLSMGDKEVFVKSILQALSIYAMQCFLFPKAFCTQMEAILNKF